MSLQKEKDLAPQKKNLKHKRESEASVVKTPSLAKFPSGLKSRSPIKASQSRASQIRAVSLAGLTICTAALVPQPNRW